MKDSVRKFVGREFLEFTEDEKSKILSLIEKQFAGNKFGIKIENSYSEDKSRLKSFIVDLSMPTIIGRDSDNARLEMRYISFLFYKRKGDIEIDWEKDIYEPFDGICYSGDILFHADWIRYRCRHKENYQKVGPYKYGDSLEDLDFSDSIEYLYRDLDSCILSAA